MQTNSTCCKAHGIYEYIDAGIFRYQNHRAKEKGPSTKKAQKSTETSLNNRGYRVGGLTRIFRHCWKTDTSANIGGKMDTVEGKRGTKTCLMNMLFRKAANLRLVFSCKQRQQSEVKRVFDLSSAGLWITAFQ